MQQDADGDCDRDLHDTREDGRWVLPHFGLNHLRDRMLRLLKACPDQSSISRAVLKWDAIDLENAIANLNLCGGMIRTNSEWLSESHGKVLSKKPVIEIIKIGPLSNSLETRGFKKKTRMREVAGKFME